MAKFDQENLESEQLAEPGHPESSAENLEQLPPSDQSETAAEKFEPTPAAEHRGPVHSQNKEAMESIRAQVGTRLDEVRESLEKTPATPAPRKQRRLQPIEKEAYIEKYLPDWLQNKRGHAPALGRVLGAVEKVKEALGFSKVTGRENLPTDQPYLLIGNHFGGESSKLFDLVPDIRIMSGEELNWKQSGFRAGMLRSLGALPIAESLRHLTPEQQATLIERVPGTARKKGYRKVMDNAASMGTYKRMADHLRMAAATLAAGDRVALFPGGLFLYEKETGLHQGYGAAEKIADEFKKITGQELTIVPVGMTKGRTSVGPGFRFSENETDLSATDWSMAHIARQLPPDKRGHYSNMVAEIGNKKSK